MPHISALRRLTAAPLAAVLLTGAAFFAAPLAAQAQTLPVNYDFAAGALAGFASPQTPPPGADIGCKPTSAHPDPVILVHGTLANQDDNWQAASPLLANHGYCVFTFNYGGTSPTADFQGTGDDRRLGGPAGLVRDPGARGDRRGKGRPSWPFPGRHDAAVLPEVPRRRQVRG